MTKPVNSDYSMVDVDLLKEHPRNARKGDIDAIAESIRVNGFFGAVIAQKSTLTILAGNHRWKAARKAGMKQVPVIVVDVDDDEALKILLADNRTSDKASYEGNELASLLQEVMTASDLTGTGWTATDLDRLIAATLDHPDQSEDVELRPIENAYYLIRGPVDRHEHVMSVLAKLEGVSVASSQN
jgi:hypothetical protein